MEQNLETGVETPSVDAENNASSNQTQEVDYKSKYEQALLEIEKQKKVKDQYASENASYKKREAEKMTDEEKKAKDLQELIDSKNRIEAELKQMKLEKEVLENGFTKEECAKLIDGNFSVKDIADILKARIDANTKSIRAEILKSNTSAPMSNTTDGSNSKSDFAKHQEKVLSRNNTGEVKL